MSPFSELQRGFWGPAALKIDCMLQLKLPVLVAEGPGPVEIVTALAEDVQKARQCKCRSASRAGHNPDSSLHQAACQLPAGTATILVTAEQLLM